MMSLLAGPKLGDALQGAHNNFALLRLLLALAVVLSHAVSVVSGHVDDEPLALSTGFTLGEHAVNGFFAISGFLVTMSYDRRGWRDYLVARILRIGPGLIVATLVVGIGFGLVFTTRGVAAYLMDSGLWRFVMQTLTTFKSNTVLPGVFGENPFRFPMGTVWTLKYEVLCYGGVVLAGLVGLIRAPRLALVAVVALTLAVMAREVFAPGSGKGIETALRLPLIFLSGGVAYVWRAKLPLSLAGLGIAVVLVAALSFTPGYKAALYPATSYAMLVLALHPALTGRVPEPSADLSYGIYLYGWPVQQGLVVWYPKAGALWLLGPALLVTVLIAFLSWKLVEQPALGLKRQFLMD
jgi:peptidoglycan/LPS O-acetylase OafA/YrhL